MPQNAPDVEGLAREPTMSKPWPSLQHDEFLIPMKFSLAVSKLLIGCFVR